MLLEQKGSPQLDWYAPIRSGRHLLCVEGEKAAIEDILRPLCLLLGESLTPAAHILRPDEGLAQHRIDGERQAIA